MPYSLSNPVRGITTGVTRHTIPLSDLPWQFGQVPRRAFTEVDVYDLPAVTEWLPAAVPGNVRSDLLALGRISDPFFGEQYQESLWVEHVDWWYRCQVKLDEIGQGRRVFIVFEGIDYLSAIFINGQELARHEGMFASQTIEITGALQRNRENAEVAVRLWGSEALPRRRLTLLQRAWQKFAGRLHGSWVGVYPDRSATLKCQMSFGWDFASPIRTMGIWDEAYLVITGPVFIAEAGVVTQVSAPSSPHEADPDIAPADFLVHLQLDSQYSCPLIATVSISPANFPNASSPISHLPVHHSQFPIHIPAGASQLTLRCHLPEVALWQPWDRGYPHLYYMTVTLAEPGGQPVDEVVLRTGVRRVELDRWQFSLNGRREFMRGLNWVPADSFPGRLRADDYARLLTLARESGANLLRVWGGGLREKQPFYDLCDELGLMVWQEFPFACMFLGAFPQDKTYLALVEAECGAMVRRLRRHPSLILWCGGNEFSRRRNQPLLKTLARLVRQEDDSRPFIPVSPLAGPSGTDSHNWLVWHGMAPLRAFQAEASQFLSEFGLQALPHLETLAAVLPEPSRPATWYSHQADLPKLRRYAALFDEQLARLDEQLGPEALAAFIQASQLAQAAGLQTAIEHMRRRKGKTGGVCLWQFNEPWPAISWAIVDYFGRPKLAYDRLLTWYNPVLVSLNFPVGRRWQPGDAFTAEVWAINDSLMAYPASFLQIELDGQIIQSQAVDLPSDSAQQIGWLNYRLQALPQALSLSLYREGELLCRNSYSLGWADPTGRHYSQYFRRWVAEWVLR